jgi:hypothetical protein
MAPDFISRLRETSALPRSYVFGSRLSAEVGSAAATFSMAPNLTSWPRWAPALSRVIWLRTPPPDRGGLQRCHVSYSSRPRLPVEVGFGAATCPTGLCATSLKHKEKPSKPACAARHAYSQHTRARFQGASHQGHHTPAIRTVRKCNQYLQGVRTDIYSAATVQLQCDASTMDHSPGTATVPSDSTVRRHTADQVQRSR